MRIFLPVRGWSRPSRPEASRHRSESRIDCPKRSRSTCRRFLLLPSSFCISKSVFVVGCHRQADRTTDRLRASVLRFGLLTKDQVRQSLAEKVDYHLHLCIDRRHIQPAIEVEHHFAVGQALNQSFEILLWFNSYDSCSACSANTKASKRYSSLNLPCTQEPPAPRLRLLIW